jgi:hypothetical protein
MLRGLGAENVMRYCEFHRPLFKKPGVEAEIFELIDVKFSPFAVNMLAQILRYRQTFYFPPSDESRTFEKQKVPIAPAPIMTLTGLHDFSPQKAERRFRLSGVSAAKDTWRYLQRLFRVGTVSDSVCIVARNCAQEPIISPISSRNARQGPANKTTAFLDVTRWTDSQRSAKCTRRSPN